MNGCREIRTVRAKLVLLDANTWQLVILIPVYRVLPESHGGMGSPLRAHCRQFCEAPTSVSRNPFS